MRDDLDAILAFIGAESLTSEEWTAIQLVIDETSTDEEVYDALLDILVARDSVSDTTDRLRYYYLAMGVEVSEPEVNDSNVFVGVNLED